MAQSNDDDLGEEVKNDLSLKGMRDNISSGVQKAKNWLSGSKPAPATAPSNQADPKDVERANESFRKAAQPAPEPAKKTKPGQRMMAGKKVQPK